MMHLQQQQLDHQSYSSAPQIMVCFEDRVIFCSSSTEDEDRGSSKMTPGNKKLEQDSWRELIFGSVPLLLPTSSSSNQCFATKIHVKERQVFVSLLFPFNKRTTVGVSIQIILEENHQKMMIIDYNNIICQVTSFLWPSLDFGLKHKSSYVISSVVEDFLERTKKCSFNNNILSSTRIRSRPQLSSSSLIIDLMMIKTKQDRRRNDLKWMDFLSQFLSLLLMMIHKKQQQDSEEDEDKKLPKIIITSRDDSKESLLHQLLILSHKIHGDFICESKKTSINNSKDMITIDLQDLETKEGEEEGENNWTINLMNANHDQQNDAKELVKQPSSSSSSCRRFLFPDQLNPVQVTPLEEVHLNNNNNNNNNNNPLPLNPQVNLVVGNMQENKSEEEESLGYFSSFSSSSSSSSSQENQVVLPVLPSASLVFDEEVLPGSEEQQNITHPKKESSFHSRLFLREYQELRFNKEFADPSTLPKTPPPSPTFFGHRGLLSNQESDSRISLDQKQEHQTRIKGVKSNRMKGFIELNIFCSDAKDFSSSSSSSSCVIQECCLETTHIKTDEVNKDLLMPHLLIQGVILKQERSLTDLIDNQVNCSCNSSEDKATFLVVDVDSLDFSKIEPQDPEKSRVETFNKELMNFLRESLSLINKILLLEKEFLAAILLEERLDICCKSLSSFCLPQSLPQESNNSLSSSSQFVGSSLSSSRSFLRSISSLNSRRVPLDYRSTNTTTKYHHQSNSFNLNQTHYFSGKDLSYFCFPEIHSCFSETIL